MLRHSLPLIIGALALTSFASAPALAGGVGLLGAAGVHSERAYFYDDEEEQFYTDQMVPNYGTGVIIMLGDRDDRIQGSMKIFWQADAAPSTDIGPLPAEFVGEEANLALRTESKNIGLATAGIQWSLFGDPSAFSVNLITNIGAAAITPDLTEFAYAEIGPGVHFSLDSSIQVFGEVLYQPRWRKTLTHGAGGALGVRYLFD